MASIPVYKRHNRGQFQCYADRQLVMDGTVNYVPPFGPSDARGACKDPYLRYFPGWLETTELPHISFQFKNYGTTVDITVHPPGEPWVMLGHATLSGLPTPGSGDQIHFQGIHFTKNDGSTTTVQVFWKDLSVEKLSCPCPPGGETPGYPPRTLHR